MSSFRPIHGPTRRDPRQATPVRSEPADAARPESGADWHIVAVSPTELRAQTRRPVRVGQPVTCATDGPAGPRRLVGEVARCAVSTITPDGLTYEVIVMLDEASSSPPAGDSAAGGVAAAGPATMPVINDDQPDLDALIQVIEEWEPSDER